MERVNQRSRGLQARQGGLALSDQAILPGPLFQTLLELERLRAERVGSCFSVVIFELEEKQRGDRRARQGATAFVDLLNKRKRAIDQVGWYDAKHVAILLPATGNEGARSFAFDILERSSSARSEARAGFRCYSYPDAAEDRLEDDRGQRARRPEASSTVPTGNGSSRHRAVNDLASRLAVGIPSWKRALDLVGSLVGLALLAPLFAIIGAYIKLVSPGPVIFRQERVGYLGRVFRCYKFRTMHVRPDNAAVHRDYLRELIQSDKPMAKLDDKRDPRIIPGGSILRRTGIDELPQIFNVLRGEMSLVGPRPCIPYEAAEYLRWHARRFDVLPGLTGLWQVSGKNHLSFTAMIRLDVKYARLMSLWLDVKIVLMTIPAIIGIVVEAAARRTRNQSSRKDGVRHALS